MLGKLDSFNAERRMGFIFKNGDQLDHQRFEMAFNYLGRSLEMLPLFQFAANNNVEIRFGTENSFNAETKVITWDPTAALNVIQANGQIGAISPAVILAHELYHAFNHSRSRPWDEYTATEFEKRLATDLGEPVRPTYDHVYALNKFTLVNIPSMHTRGDKWYAKNEVNDLIQGGPYDPLKLIHVWEGTPGGGGDGGGGNEMGFPPGYWDGTPHHDIPPPFIPGGYWNPVHPNSLPAIDDDEILLFAEQNNPTTAEAHESPILNISAIQIVGVSDIQFIT